MHLDHNGKLLFLIIIIAILQIVTIIIAILKIVILFFLDRLKVAAKKNVRKSLLVRQEEQPLVIFKGIVPHKIFYRSNLCEGCLELSSRVASRSQGTNFQTKIVFWTF